MKRSQLRSFLYILYHQIIKRFIDPVSYAKFLGVNIGKNCRLVGNVRFGSEPYLISLGDHVSITSSQFITHDGGIWVFREKFPNIDLIAPISVGNNVFIGSNCTILPGVNIGDNVVVGAGSVVTKDLAPDYVYAGIPARPIKTIAKYWESLQGKLIMTKLIDPSEKEKCLRKMFNIE
ncbi:MAG: capsule biosynthesis protein CapG [Flavobacterium sp.]|nr:capsule biosynthesis protein CapG [Flavobacterium sp.]